MPKAAKQSTLRRQVRRALVSEPLASLAASRKRDEGLPGDNVEEGGVPKSQDLSRGQRKRQAKRDRYVQKERMILSTLKLKASEEQKLRIDGLDAIRDALLNTTKTESGEDQEPTQSHSMKSRNAAAASDINHFNLVLQHPAFKADPITTMQEHLSNTLAAQKARNEKASKQLLEKEIQMKKERKAKKRDAKRGSRKSSKKFKVRRTI